MKFLTRFPILFARNNPQKVSRSLIHADTLVENEKRAWQWTEPEGHHTGIKIRNSYKCCGTKNQPEVPFIVKDPRNVTWYSCGPTVYDSSHLGHAVCYVRFDIIRRILEKYFNLQFYQVMGITDVDNKIHNKTLLYEADIKEVTSYYISEFKYELQALNVLPPRMYIPVTTIIQPIIQFVDELLKKGRAYSTPRGDVYYIDAKNPIEIHKLTNPSIDEVDTPDVFDERQNIRDFCLWKAAGPGEPYWDAPWGKGRPGWHIECSAAGSLVFGENMDLHTGGLDLKFPHHEYEMAQCEAFHENNQWVNYFLHSGPLIAPNSRQKMSKSKGQAWYIKDILKSEHPWFTRMLCFHSPFQREIRLYPDVLESTRSKIIKFELFDEICKQYIVRPTRGGINEAKMLKDIAKLDEQIMNCFKSNLAFQAAMKRLLLFMEKWTSEIKKELDSPAPYHVTSASPVVQAHNAVLQHFTNMGFSSHQPPPPQKNPLYKNYPQFQS